MSSRIPGFFKLDIPQRIEALQEQGLLSQSDAQSLTTGTHTLRTPAADRMIENVVGVFGLPLGLGLNFLINGKDVVIPLTVEEPSIVAGLSGTARITRLAGGIEATTTPPILTGQVQIADIKDAPAAKASLLENRDAILNLANSFHPKMVARGGGAQEIEVFTHEHVGESKQTLVVLHLHVDTRDAMGANVVNGMCEGIASLLETITGGTVFLRILSNLTDQALVTAKMRVSVENLETKNYTGERVRDGIVLANDWALVDRYRAVTHNKGIMNGVDALAIATGNDFRAIEAAAHAYAARDGQYRALTHWRKGENGDLEGSLTMPMKVGTVGGSIGTNPTVKICHAILGSPNAAELAGILGAVGLAQNYAALRSLATAGIQQHHMTLQARNVAANANVPDEYFDTVVDALIEDGDIKVWKAQNILKKIQNSDSLNFSGRNRSNACGKVILFGEHAVVYGRPALAVPLPLAIEALVVESKEPRLVVPRWGIDLNIPTLGDGQHGLVGVITQLLNRLGLSDKGMTIEIFPNIPRAMGLGGSAALAVAVLRALNDYFELELSLDRINELAYECELAAHGNPSGVDNTIATYGKPLVFQHSEGISHQEISPGQPIPLVIGMSGKESLTANMVEQVRQARTRQHGTYELIFDQIARVTNDARQAFQDGRLDILGELMNVNHGYLNALQLSTPELEEMVFLARGNGAIGAKLTGAGGGGSVVMLCPDSQDNVSSILETAGYTTLTLTIE